MVLFEDAGYVDLLPLVYWRCAFALRLGRKSLVDNAASSLGTPISGVWARSYMAPVCALRIQIPANKPADDQTVLINGRWLVPGPIEFEKGPFVARCGDDIAYVVCDSVLAERLNPEIMLHADACLTALDGVPSGEIEADFVRYPWDLVARNADMLRRHWRGDDRAVDGDVSSSAFLVNTDHIHVGERSVVKPTAVITAENGPIFISNDVLIDVHTYIEGPAYIGPGTVVKPFSCIRGGTTIGSMCRVGGEIGNSILAGYTYKQHHGFLGSAYVGGWVNFGAGATNSNLKNTYGDVDVQIGTRTVQTHMRYFGCAVGDFVRLGIGTMIPTGALLGFAAMCATGGLIPKYVPSLGWLTPGGLDKTDPVRLQTTFKQMMLQRKVDMPAEEMDLLVSMPERIEQYAV